MQGLGIVCLSLVGLRSSGAGWQDGACPLRQRGRSSGEEKAEGSELKVGAMSDSLNGRQMEETGLPLLTGGVKGHRAF